MGKTGAQVSKAKGAGGAKAKAVKQVSLGPVAKGTVAKAAKVQFGEFVAGMDSKDGVDAPGAGLPVVANAVEGQDSGAGVGFPPLAVNSGCKSSQRIKGNIVDKTALLVNSDGKSALEGDSSTILGTDTGGQVAVNVEKGQDMTGSADLVTDAHATSQVLASLGLGVEGLFDDEGARTTLFRDVLDATEARVVEGDVAPGVAANGVGVGDCSLVSARGPLGTNDAGSSKGTGGGKGLYDTTSTIAAKARAKAQQPEKTYKSLFPENRHPAKGLRLDHVDLGEGEIVLDEEDATSVESAWGFCLIGCFTGRFPGGKAVEEVTGAWKVRVKILPYSKGWTIFRFQSEEDRDKVFNGGPYMIYGKTLMLKHIPADGVLDADLFLDIPLWVKFYDVPLRFWTVSGLSKIASKLGKPIHTDQFTRERSRASFARVLVEVDMRGAPIHEYPVRLPGGILHTQRVSYEDFPEFCYHCRSFGHHYERCPAQKVQENVRVPEQEPPQAGVRAERRGPAAHRPPAIPDVQVIADPTSLSDEEKRTMERIVCDVVEETDQEITSGDVQCKGGGGRLIMGSHPPPPMFDSSRRTTYHSGLGPARSRIDSGSLGDADTASSSATINSVEDKERFMIVRRRGTSPPKGLDCGEVNQSPSVTQ